MKIISGQRGCGKSSELIKYAYENDVTIVCKNPQHHLLLAKELEIPFGAVRFITYREFDNPTEKAHRCSYVIDDMDMYLNYRNIVGYTETID